MGEGAALLDSAGASTAFEPVSLDQLIERANALGSDLPPQCKIFAEQIADLGERLAHGRVRLAILGQFNRGKSSFLNALLGLDVLPVSVLPLTSVPTYISYGDRLACSIRFIDGTPPLTAVDSNEAIGRLLRTYVTEEANPQNRRGVLSAELSCPSDVLAHGTVLIDTPGFGSTFAHNTKTTFDLIAGCDAAILLLSADLPITQAEIEFLRELHRFVPRIFFVYNKVDLLDAEDLRMTQQFIRDTLTANLPFLVDPHLFPVSARRALDKKDPASPSAGGLEQVKADIVDFLLRDKFFALSHGLNKKFMEAIDGILAVLDHRHGELADRLEAAARTVRQLETALEALHRERGNVSGVKPADRKALEAGAAASIERERERVAEAALDLAADCVGTSAVTADLIRRVCTQYFRDAFERMQLETCTEINRAFRPIAADLELSFRGLVGRTASAASGSELAGLPSLSLSPIEVTRPASWSIADPSVALAGARFGLFERLSARAARRQTIRRRLKGAVKDITETNCLRLTQALQSSVAGAADAIDGACTRAFDRLDAALNEAIAVPRAAHAALLAQSKPELDAIDALRNGFAEIRKQLSI